MTEALVKVRDLKMHFAVGAKKYAGSRSDVVRAVDGVTFEVFRGETLGLVGESGCGKSTTGRALIQLHRPTSGKVFFNNVNLCELNHRELKGIRRDLQMIFQDPYASLNPRMTVGDIIGEPLRVHGLHTGAKRKARIQELMELVGLDPRFIRRYPHEFSGGQRQRIGIARAIACEPKFIVCDEPISALDVSIQAQIINLLAELQSELGLTYLFIAHDLAAVRHISDRVAVMYLGHLVEIADAATLYENPSHPYTQALISAVPIPDPDVEAVRERIVLQGDVPSAINPPSGCPFRTRCPKAMDICAAEMPMLKEIAPSQRVACHLPVDDRALG